MHKNCNLLPVKKIWCWAFSFQIKQYVWKIRVFYSNSDIEASCQHHSDLHTPIYRTPSESKWSQSILTYNCTAKWTIPHFYAKTSILIHLKPKKRIWPSKVTRIFDQIKPSLAESLYTEVTTNAAAELYKSLFSVQSISSGGQHQLDGDCTNWLQNFNLVLWILGVIIFPSTKKLLFSVWALYYDSKISFLGF